VSITSEPNTAVTVNVVRNGVVIANANGTTDATGLIEVNHPGGVCWNGSTPDILTGDVVQALTAPDTGDAATTADGMVTQPAFLVDPATGATLAAPQDGANVVIKGFARDLVTGAPLPASEIQQRTVAGGSRFQVNGRRDLRAGAVASDGTFAYDAPGS